MNHRPTLLAIALVSLPAVAHAQATPSPTAGDHVLSEGLSRAVPLTRGGVHSTPEHAVADGLELVDVQRVDVDADGDLDVLGFVDLSESADETKPELGRGVVVIFRERHGWRGETVASVGRWPVEAGFNWGEVERLRAGATPLLHVLYSTARPGGTTAQSDTVVRFEAGSLRAVFESPVVRSAQRVTVHASDVDGDGTSELVEQVATEAHCDRGVPCVPASESRRVFRWDDAHGEFVAMDPAGPIASVGTRRGRSDTVAIAVSSREH